MIVQILAWLDLYPEIYRLVSLVMLVGAAVVAWKAETRESPDATSRSNFDWRWALIISLLLLAGRWPVLFVTRDLNPDEAQQIAGALTLWHDPVFWRSVDGNTAGPLNFYALWPVSIGIGEFNYFAARLWTLFCTAATCIALTQILTRFFGRSVARSATLLTTGFLTLTQLNDFIHYTTEVVPITVITVGLALGLASKPTTSRLIVSGALLGSAPWAKLQAGPISLVCILVVAMYLTRSVSTPPRARLWSALLGGAALPTFVVAVIVMLTGQVEPAVHGYLTNNLAYVGRHVLPTWEVLMLIWSDCSQDGIFNGWLLASLAWLALAWLALRKSEKKPATAPAAAAGVIVLAAAVSILTPQRPFAHYLHFLWPALTLLVGATLGRLKEALPSISARRWTLSLALGGALLLALVSLLRPVRFVGQLATLWSTPQTEPARILLSYAKPGEALGLWGWMPGLYVETQLRQATRQAHSEAEFRPGPAQAYHRKIYMEDLQKNRPPVFADTVGASDWVWQDRRLGHEIFPELQAWLKSSYLLAADSEGVRIYVRRDRAATTITPSPSSQ